MTIEILQSTEKALVNMDSDTLVNLYSEDFLFEDTASGDRITDKESLRIYFDQLFSLPKVKFSNVSFFGFGDHAAGQWTWSGTSPESGLKYSIQGASLFKIEKNKIKEEIIFYDPRPFNS